MVLAALGGPPGRQMPSMQIQDPDRLPRNKIATCQGVAYVVGYSTASELALRYPLYLHMNHSPHGGPDLTDDHDTQMVTSGTASCRPSGVCLMLALPLRVEGIASWSPFPRKYPGGRVGSWKGSRTPTSGLPCQACLGGG